MFCSWTFQWTSEYSGPTGQRPHFTGVGDIKTLGNEVKELVFLEKMPPSSRPKGKQRLRLRAVTWRLSGTSAAEKARATLPQTNMEPEN